MPRSTALVLAAIASALTLPASAAPRADEVTLDAYDLTFDFGAFDEMSESPASGSPIEKEWKGKLGEVNVGMALVVFAVDDNLTEPGGSTEAILDYLRRGGGFQVEESWYPEGPFGSAPFASIAKGPLDGGSQYILGGLLPEYGYALHIECRPALDSKAEKKLRGFLEKGIEYSGEERDREWTDDEVRARWERYAPDDLHQDFFDSMKRPGFYKKIIVRTKNYIIMTNSGGGKLFAQKMDENYKTIKKLFPFDEVKERRLMPVFLFRTPEQYRDFCEKVTGNRRPNSGGHAWRDYYATWYESPVAPVHIHEQTHQIFANRLRLGGGGSWYQEGMAEYVETSENDRNIVARKVRDGEHTPLHTFVTLASLLDSSKDDNSGESAAGNNYKQAALLIEFMRESKFAAKHFEEWLYATGTLPRGDRDAIEAVFKRIYDKDLAGIEEEWRDYCKKR